jgi:hypothetical protein
MITKLKLHQFSLNRLVLTMVLVGLTVIISGQAVYADDPVDQIPTATQQFVVTLTDSSPITQKFVVTLTESTYITQKFVVTLTDAITANQKYIITLYDPNAISLSVDKTAFNLSGLPSVLMADHLTATVTTGNPAGYRLTIEADEPRLKCVSSNNYIVPLTSAGAMTDNHWGWSRDDASTPTTTPGALTWAGLSSSATEIKITSTATDPFDGEDTRVWLGTQVDLTLPACKYVGEVTITAAAN